MKQLLIIFSIFSITTLPAMAAETITVVGNVVDENDIPLVGVNVYNEKNGNGEPTDITGTYNITLPPDSNVVFEYLGYETQIHPIKELNLKTIKLLPDNYAIDEIQVKVCNIDKNKGHKTVELINDKCVPTSCITPRWQLSGTGENRTCAEQKCEIENGTGKWELDGDTWKCEVASCDTANGWIANKSNTKCNKTLKECSDEQKRQHPHATQTGIKSGTNTCIAQDCKCGYKLKNDKCEKWADNEPCTADTKPSLPGNAKNGVLKCDGEKPYCEVGECNDGYKRSDDKKSCTSTRGDDCDATAVDPNATAGTNKKVNGKITCVITACGKGFHPNKDGTKCAPAELSESDSQKKVDELKENAQKMKDKEQSTENKLLGAAGIGATGIGGMQMASAMAEQNADAAAERDMTAYLATFHCNYGGGKNVEYGETDVELPGGNELIGLYTEYVNLANDLKVRKTALDMRPGIESESILDSATSGLYDDVAVGKTSGAYASLARALLDPNGADAAAWAKQKEDTASKKKTGMITAGIGAAGSLIGNLAINSGDDKKEKSAEIIAKYEKLKQPFQDTQKKIDKISAKQCSDYTGTTGTGTAPNCTCTDPKNTRFKIEDGGCVKCDNDMVYNDKNECVCPADKPRNESGQCVAQIQQCNLTGLVANGECKCITGASADGNNNECKCTGNYIQLEDQCKEKIKSVITADTTQLKLPQLTSSLPNVDIENLITSTKTIVTINIQTDATFKSGSAKLENSTISALNELNSKLDNYSDILSDGNFCIIVTGYTDRVPFKKSINKTNEQLATERANAIKTELLKNSKIKEANIQTSGYGEEGCDPDTYPQINDPKCRRVDIVLNAGPCSH